MRTDRERGAAPAALHRGADSIAGTEQKVSELQADIDLNRERFVSLDPED